MRLVPVPLPVQGALDTADPLENRAPGTLVEAVDLHPLKWGPRGGFTSQSRVYRCATFPNPQIPTFDGSLGCGTIAMTTRQQADLPTKWTLDLVFRPELVTHSSDATVPILQHWLGYSAIKVSLNAGGQSAGNQRKVVAAITPSSAAGVAGTTTTLTGTSQLTVGVTVDKTHHVRVQRVANVANLWVDGTLEATTSAVSASQRHEGSGTGTVYLAKSDSLASGATHYYKGMLMRAVLRTGAAADVTKGMRDFRFPKTAGVRWCLSGRHTMPGLNQREESPYGSLLTWTSISLTDVTEPAPWTMPGVQGGCYFVDMLGRAWNAVVAGGVLYVRRVG